MAVACIRCTFVLVAGLIAGCAGKRINLGVRWPGLESENQAMSGSAEMLSSDIDEFEDSNSSSRVFMDDPIWDITGPVADDMYPANCPFETWFSNRPSDYEYWQQLLLGKFDNAWHEAGSPTGVRENDHNYNTALGQGNTLGFLEGQLHFDTESWPLKYGLFNTTGAVPAVVRISDFGADDSSMRLTRMAVKVPLLSAWGGEANLLFTESLDVFPIANYEELSAYAGDDHKSWWQRLADIVALGTSTLEALVFENYRSVVMGEAFKNEVLAKTFYSQLPYMLGEEHAMKFSLVPLQETCREGQTSCCVPPGKKPSREEAKDFSAKSANITAAYLRQCEARFHLQLQVKRFQDDRDMITRHAALRWPESPVTVATLVIPRQDCHDGTGVNAALQQALAQKLEISPEGVDKAFAFHPINNHEANRPVGDVQSFRGGFYSQHAKMRFGTMHEGVFKTNLGTKLRRPAVMPWSVF